MNYVTVSPDRRTHRNLPCTMVAAALVGVGLLSAAVPVGASHCRAASHTGPDRAEIRKDNRELAADIHDLRRLEVLIAELDRAHRERDEQREAWARRRVYALLRQETAEARKDLAADRREARRSSRELRETRGDPHEAGQGRAQLRDDLRDLERSRARLERQLEIVAALRALHAPRRSPGNVRAKERALFEEFLRIAREDARETRRELGEDRRELGNDRTGWY